MESVITIPLRSGSFGALLLLLLIGLAGLGACQTRYFQADIGEMLVRDSAVLVMLPSAWERFELTMEQMRYFKNNVEERVLLTRNSRLHQGLVFLNENDNALPNKFHRFEMWLPRSADRIGAYALRDDQRVALLSIRGKKDATGQELYELVHVYLGTVRPDSLRIAGVSPGRKIMRPQKRITFTGKGRKYTSRHTRRNMDLLAFIQSGRDDARNVDYIEVQALLDNNHNQIGAEKAMIFDFRQIYGEPLWLVRSSD
jgi:hypothetical protein